MTSINPVRMVVAVTGAGGTRLAGSALSRPIDDERVGHVDLMVSANGRTLIAFDDHLRQARSEDGDA